MIQPPTYYGNRHIICSSTDKSENQLDNSAANYFTEENNNYSESEQIQLNKDQETSRHFGFCTDGNGNMTSKVINDLNIDKINVNGFNKKDCSLILNGAEDLLDSSELISANNLTTPFSVKDILNLVDQTAESYSKMTTFNGSFETEEDGIKSMDALVEEASPKCYAESYAYPNQYHYTPTYDHSDYYNSFHNTQHHNFSFYGAQEHASVYFANQYDNSSAYHPAILPDYCPPYSSTPNLHYAPSVCQYNSPYANGYQSEIYNQSTPATFNESPTKHETSAVSSTASTDLSFLADDVQGSSRSSCAVNGVSAPSFSHSLESSVPHHETSNIGGLTSQHVRQLNSLCAPYEKKQKETKHRDSESCDSMQSEYLPKNILYVYWAINNYHNF